MFNWLKLEVILVRSSPPKYRGAGRSRPSMAPGRRGLGLGAAPATVSGGAARPPGPARPSGRPAGSVGRGAGAAGMSPLTLGPVRESNLLFGLLRGYGKDKKIKALRTVRGSPPGPVPSSSLSLGGPRPLWPPPPPRPRQRLWGHGAGPPGTPVPPASSRPGSSGRGPDALSAGGQGRGGPGGCRRPGAAWGARVVALVRGLRPRCALSGEPRPLPVPSAAAFVRRPWWS